MKNKFGVPCSKIKHRIGDAEVPCSTEEEAMAMAAGASFVKGTKPEVYMQNTGLIRSLNVLLTLYLPYAIPYPTMLISNRSKPYHHHFVFDFIGLHKHNRVDRHPFFVMLEKRQGVTFVDEV